MCVKQDHFTKGSCSTPGSTTWWSRPFYWDKIQSNPQSVCWIWWVFNESRTFWRVSKVCFSSYFQNLLKVLIFVEFGLIMLLFINICLIFKGSKHAILGKNHRQGLRSGSRNRAWTKTFFWCILLRDKASKIPGSLILRFLRWIFFRKFSSNFWFFVAIVGKISSSSCQSRRKNSKIHWYGLFLAGRKCPGYLARARARARARAPGPRVALGPPALLTVGDYDQRLFARAQLSKKTGVSLNFPLAMIVSWALARLFAWKNE